MNVLRVSAIGLAFALLLVAPPSSAQLWPGILNASRGTDWSHAGAIGASAHSSTWAQCGPTVLAGTTATVIQNDINGCPANTYLLLGPGTFNLSGGITITRSNVALRGSGANQTFIVFGSGANASCNGLGSVICVEGSNQYPGGNPSGINWASGFAQGTTQITLASTSGISPNQTILWIDQCDTGTSGSPCTGSETDNGNFYVCSDPYSSGPHGCAGEDPSNAYRTKRSEIQGTYATAVSGNVVTLADPIVAPNWTSARSPQVWLYNPIVEVGIENLSIDATAAGNDGILLYGCLNCWVTGNRIVDPDKRAIYLFETVHADVQQNYTFKAQNSDPYCIDPDYTSFIKIENNILQNCRSTIVFEGPDVGSVIGYNYSVYDNDNGNDAFMWFSLWTHSATSMYDLFEGNVGNGLALDNIHGAHLMNTLFRNYYSGWEPGKNTQTAAIYDAAYARYSNIIGNVLGHSGTTTVYQSTSDSTNAVYALGLGKDDNNVPTDLLVQTTSMRWGNYDTVSGAVRWCGNPSDTGWSSICSGVSEIPTGLSVYAASLPILGDVGLGQSNMPASFYLTGKPSWWNSEPWPAIGPDVTGGTVYGTNGPAYGAAGSTSWNPQSVGGHANDIPAMDCFKNIMKGLADGTGSVLSFNAEACYGGTQVTPPETPGGLTENVR